jgi:hypothetical protein
MKTSFFIWFFYLLTIPDEGHFHQELFSQTNYASFDLCDGIAFITLMQSRDEICVVFLGESGRKLWLTRSVPHMYEANTSIIRKHYVSSTDSMVFYLVH